MSTDIFFRMSDFLWAVWIHWWSFMTSYPTANLPIWLCVLAGGFLAWLADKRPKWHEWIEKHRKSYTIAKWLLVVSLGYACWASYDDLNSDVSLWKPLTQIQSKQFLEAAKPVSFEGFGRIGIFYRDACEECKKEANDIADLLTQAGWPVAIPSGELLGNADKGILIMLSHRGVNLDELWTLTHALQSARILFSVNPQDTSPVYMIEILVDVGK